LLSTVSDPTSPGPSGGPRGKRATRQTLLALRDALTPETRETGSRAICDRVTALIAHKLPAGSVLALYAAKESEVDPLAIGSHAAKHGLRVVYPRIVPGDRRLAFHEVAATQLVPGKFGLKEPGVDAPAVALSEITAFLVPGLAFDHAGGRVGWGRGYYDATLEAVPAALRIGLAFECQVVDRIVREPHDMPVNYLITEAATYAVE
jgi:5-formyltetrahydrofolate cyclo-ligase